MSCLKSLVAAVVFGLAATGAATAAEKCSQKAFAGVWAIVSSSPQVCLVEINGKGDITESRCYLDADPGNPVGSLSGTIAVSRSCQVTGKIMQKIGKKTFKGTVKATATAGSDGAVIVGSVKSSAGSVRLAGYQQW